MLVVIIPQLLFPLMAELMRRRLHLILLAMLLLSGQKEMTPLFKTLFGMHTLMDQTGVQLSSFQAAQIKQLIHQLHPHLPFTQTK